MKKSEEFIKKNPKSIYLEKVLRDRAGILEQQSWKFLENEGKKLAILKAVEEYKKSLSVDYKNPLFYPSNLENLSELYRYNLMDQETSKIFSDAVEEYYQRFQEEDPQISTVGVNDFLKARGVDLNE